MDFFRPYYEGLYGEENKIFWKRIKSFVVGILKVMFIRVGYLSNLDSLNDLKTNKNFFKSNYGWEST